MSELRANTISDAAGTGPVTLTGQSAAKAWYSYRQDTTTILKDLNTSSISDDSDGHYSVSFTNSFVSASYSALGSASRYESDIRNNIWGLDVPDNVPSTSGYSVLTHAINGTALDSYNTTTHFGDLA